jgi:adenine-specific DNA-methyltransferase
VNATLPDHTVLAELPALIECMRLDSGRKLDPARRSSLGQFFTPAPIAALMASYSSPKPGLVRLLDPGAGIGMLSAAWVAHACSASERPERIEVVAYEVDNDLTATLREVLEICTRIAEQGSVALTFEIREEDFIEAAVRSLDDGLFDDGVRWPEFDAAILNPPYKKFRTDSLERRLLRRLGIETSNLYTAFVELALRGLNPGGELIAITPRSFCNGPYFAQFRKHLLSLSGLTHLHVFDSRDTAFSDDAVLQENVIFRVERGVSQAADVAVEWSDAGDLEHTTRRDVPFSQVVHSNDPDLFIHIAPDEWDAQIARIVESLPATLSELGVKVSTGRVVDFRAKEYLRAEPESGTVPLIYPTHFAAGEVEWPRPGRKPNALALAAYTESQINPVGTYVLVKRFSAKEERRRVAAAILTPDMVPGDHVAFENHLNYFHKAGHGLPIALARGLVAFLNSTLVDSYFRQFNGHTQVNATDLRKLRYPSIEQLECVAARLDGVAFRQERLDEILEGVLLSQNDGRKHDESVERRIVEASAILTALGLPREQTNERAALTLLALLDLRPTESWVTARNPRRGVTPIMAFAAEHYGKQWAPNTRETVRRSTLHQFRDAGLVVPNPDKPTRPVNSPAYCYQVPDAVLRLVRSYGSSEWERVLGEHLVSALTLAEKYASEREMARIPLRIQGNKEVTLSPGGQNELIAEIVEQFCPRFTPGAVPLYIGDADAKWAYFDEAALLALGVTVDAHGKMPDVVIHYSERDWLVLVEAVTSHGPINAKRRGELKALFASSSAPLVYVTAFMSRRAMNRYLGEISWESEVWIAEAPTHLIHFDGERFLGPYDS